MKRIGLAVLVLGLVLGGCAQDRGRTRQEAARLDALEAGFTRFQDQQRARDLEIDLRLREIAERLDRLSSGKPPAPAGRAARRAQAMPRTAPARPPLRIGQVVPYTTYLDPSRGAPAAPSMPLAAPQAPPAPAVQAPAPSPAPAVQAPTARPAPGDPARTPVPLAPGQGVPPAAPAPVGLAHGGEYEVSPPVVTLDEAQRNVPPAALPAARQPVPATRARGARPAAPQPVQPERRPEPMAPAPVQPMPPAPAAPGPALPSLDPAVPAPPVTAPVPAPGQSRAQGGPEGQAPAVSLDEQRLYTDALRAVSSNRNEEGRRKFNEFLAKYPASAKTPEALYWIGESYMGDKSYNQAILSFKEVTTRFPKDPKSDEALYRVADAYEQLGDKANAAFHLRLLVEEHPGSEFAGKARQKLKQLGQ